MGRSTTDGKICYVEIPAEDIGRSAEFCSRAFGWGIRQRGNGSTAFDDTTGQVSGAFVAGRPPMSEPGPLIYVMVDDIEDALRRVEAAGGVIVQAVGADAPELTARFRHPGGNAPRLYQEPVRQG